RQPACARGPRARAWRRVYRWRAPRGSGTRACPRPQRKAFSLFWHCSWRPNATNSRGEEIREVGNDLLGPLVHHPVVGVGDLAHGKTIAILGEGGPGRG